MDDVGYFFLKSVQQSPTPQGAKRAGGAAEDGAKGGLLNIFQEQLAHVVNQVALIWTWNFEVYGP